MLALQFSPHSPCFLFEIPRHNGRSINILPSTSNSGNEPASLIKNRVHVHVDVSLGQQFVGADCFLPIKFGLFDLNDVWSIQMSQMKIYK